MTIWAQKKEKIQLRESKVAQIIKFQYLNFLDTKSRKIRQHGY